MQKIEIQGEYRKKSGKGIARQIRREGKIPGVIYSNGSSTPLVLHPKEIGKVLHSTAGENTLITLNITGEEEDSRSHVAILRDYQKDPINGKILHADLFEISMTEPIDVKVLVEITGETPVGVKAEGGVLRQHVREIEVRCLPTEIPDHIEVDASGLAVGEHIYIRDLDLPESIKILDHEEQAILSVTSSISEEKLEALLSSTSGEEDTEQPATEEKVPET